ncbi:MAG: DUF1328 family protein [Methyloceanibacter sp.]|uniref:DUF1328 family protein n=1 Tax=Methyloceanibacter sp. TaxID=1965321 RepID=UPI003EE18348
MGDHRACDLGARGAFGFTRLEHGAAKVARLLFFIFLALFAVILILSFTIGDWR